MNKIGRKVSALLLAAAVTAGTVFPAFAAGSPVEGNGDSNTTVSGITKEDGTVEVDEVTSTTDTATIPAEIESDGKAYKVSVIKTGTFKARYKRATLVLNSDTKVEASIAKSKKAKKTKKFVIKAASGQKLKAKQFNKKAFKDFKGKIVVKKSAMSKKQFNKLKKKLIKGGFKGKIVYKE